MPVVYRSHGFTFFFYSHEPNEPPHVHVDKGDGTAKVWLEQVTIARDYGLKAKELAHILELTRANREMMLKAWHGYFGNGS